MIYREEIKDIDTVGKDYYKINYLNEDFARAIGLDVDIRLKIKRVILDQDKGVIYLIYPTGHLIYLDYIEKLIVDLRNFLTSIENKDIITTNKLAVKNEDIVNIKWDSISRLYKTIFDFTNAEILVCKEE